MNTLRDLLHPFDTDRFLNEYWTRQPVIIAGADDKIKNLFSWEKYGDLINRHLADLVAPKLRMHTTRSGFVDLTENLPTIDGGVLRQTSARLLNDHCQEGATLVVDQIHKYVPGLQQLCDTLAAELGERVQINSFASWKGARGFPPHYDPHELFIIQIAGEKRWELLGQSFAHPLPEHRSNPEDRPDTVVLAGTLTAGDVMYMPRGTWHRTVTSDQPSLHLAVGVNCRNGIDLLVWVMEELKNNPSLRQNLPLSYRPGFSPGYDGEAMKPVLANLGAAVSELLHADDTLDRYNENCLLGDRPHTRFVFPNLVSPDMLPDGEKSRFYRPSSQRVIIRPLSDATGPEGARDAESTDGVQVLVWGKELLFGGDVHGLIARLFSAERFTGSDVLSWSDGFTWDDIAPILEQLVAEQILFVDGSGR